MSPPLPLELQSRPRTLPRGVPSTRFANLFLGLFLAIGVGFGVAAYVVSSGMDAGTGPAAGTGTVVRVEVARSGKTTRAKVDFRHDGVDATCTARPADAAGLVPGDERPYWNVDGAPALEPCARSSRRSATGMVIGFSIAGPFEAILGLVLSMVIRRRARLFGDGEGAVGVVTSAKRWGRGLSIRYEVTVPVQLRGKAFLDARRLTGSQRERPPEPGSPVFVVYDPERPQRSAVWSLP